MVISQQCRTNFKKESLIGDELTRVIDWRCSFPAKPAGWAMTPSVRNFANALRHLAILNISSTVAESFGQGKVSIYDVYVTLAIRPSD